MPLERLPKQNEAYQGNQLMSTGKRLNLYGGNLVRGNFLRGNLVRGNMSTGKRPNVYGGNL